MYCASTGEHLDFNVTRCRFVEMYEEMGLGEIADVLSCNRDGEFASAFDPSISLDRPQTIAKGRADLHFPLPLQFSGPVRNDEKPS